MHAILCMSNRISSLLQIHAFEEALSCIRGKVAGGLRNGFGGLVSLVGIYFKMLLPGKSVCMPQRCFTD